MTIDRLCAVGVLAFSMALQAEEFTLGFDKARPYEAGFTRDGDEIVVDNGDDASRRAGVSWSLVLTQKECLHRLVSQLLLDYLIAQLYALVTNINTGTGHQLADLVLHFPTE